MKQLKKVLSICLAICMLITMATPSTAYAASKSGKSAKVLTITAKDVKNGNVTIKKGSYKKIVIAKNAAGANIKLKNVSVKSVQVNGSKKAAQTTVNLSGKTKVTKVVAKSATKVTTNSKKSKLGTVSVQTSATVTLNTPANTVTVAASAKNATVKLNAAVTTVNVNGKNGTVAVKDGVTVSKVVTNASGTEVTGKGSVEKVNVKAANVSINVDAGTVVTSAKATGTVVNGIDIPASSKAEVSSYTDGSETITNYIIQDNVTNETTEGKKVVTVSDTGEETATITETVTDATGEVVKQVETVVDETGQTTTTTTDKDGNVTTTVTDENGNDVTPATPDTPSEEQPTTPDTPSEEQPTTPDTPSEEQPTPDTPSEEQPTPDTPSTGNNNTPVASVDVTGVSLTDDGGTALSAETPVCLAVGVNANLTVVIAPENATTKTVTCESDDTSVATASVNGSTIAVTGVGMGTTTITVTSTSNTSVSATYTVVVVPAVTVAECTDDGSQAENKLSHNEGLENGNGSSISTYDATKTNQAACTSTQTVTKAEDGTYVTNITVSAPVASLQKFYSSNSGQNTEGSPDAWLGMLLNFGRDIDSTMYYSSDGSSYSALDAQTADDQPYSTKADLLWLKVDKKVVSAKPGTLYFRYGASEGSTTVKIVVSVIDTSVTGVTLTSTDTITLNVGATTEDANTHTATVTPDNSANTSVTYTSSDETVATVDASTGVVTAKGVGTATITAASAVNPAAKASYTVTVIPSVTLLAADSVNHNEQYRADETTAVVDTTEQTKKNQAACTVSSTYTEKTIATTVSADVSTLNVFQSYSQYQQNAEGNGYKWVGLVISAGKPVIGTLYYGSESGNLSAVDEINDQAQPNDENSFLLWIKVDGDELNSGSGTLTRYLRVGEDGTVITLTITVTDSTATPSNANVD
jgi:uncharacterized protein YjdB